MVLGRKSRAKLEINQFSLWLWQACEAGLESAAAFDSTMLSTYPSLTTGGRGEQ